MTRLAQDTTGGGPIQAVGWGTVQNVAISSSSTQITNKFGIESVVVRLRADQDCYIEFGVNPTATSSSTYFEAGTEYVRVNPGEKLAVIRVSDDGVLNVTECR